MTSKDNPDTSTGMWCADCGHAMVHNVPRLGPNGGYVHKDTAQFDCGPRKELQVTSDSMQQGNFRSIPDLIKRHAELEKLVKEKDNALIDAEHFCEDRADEIRDGASGLTAHPEGFWRDAARMMKRALDLEVQTK